MQQSTIRAMAGGLVLAICTPLGYADSWTCRQAGLTRQVTLYYPQSPARLPCRVYYSKPDENAIPRALWKARYVESFCTDKARELVDLLQSTGWQCTADE